MRGDRMAVAWRWLTDYTAQPHPDLGRDGVVCPFMVRALRRGYVTMVEFDATEGDAALIALARKLRGDMERRGEEIGSDQIYLVSLVVPYGLPDPELKAMVGRVHATIKPEWVQRGFMAGDFWPDHETVGLHSDTFRPFASPIPMLGMRPMVPMDLLFFVKHERTAADRLTYLRYFRHVFRGKLNDYWQERLDAAEVEAERELATLSQEPPGKAR
ncbi:hypothetical protein TH66_02750 [Carbonactinospora thermoautotrophica]|uniref:DUF6875 domain-containing protein n=1 Tax=Carbonactinospora thermoautotrophica TaxID=1469144 RepID=A0A132MSK9_9ACTN|nr:hypothetical protein [Carbonactinospora thermoautotrophica]KWX00857.1 hypothetical protein LI90_1885 [Carbonactinospora thermoautotrophica]KWX04310.1 hypothetical protein TR74_24410 [Carbonactinospora thermoautotrophica]KWX05225.1 hypothetical protein TH66_02750 [Carbonactinospora thermoautotrophica]